MGLVYPDDTPRPAGDYSILAVDMLMFGVVDFIETHRRCGTLTGDASDVTAAGYLLTITCPCGVVFMRWVTAHDAIGDLVFSPVTDAGELTVRRRRDFCPRLVPTSPTMTDDPAVRITGRTIVNAR